MPPQTPAPEGNADPLEKLEQKLYAQKPVDPFPVPVLTTITAPEAKPVGWVPPPPPLPPPPKKPLSKSVIFLIVAAGFFVLAAIAAAAFLIFGSRSVSTDRVFITADAPSAIASGERISLLISVENKNPVLIHSTVLSVDFPETARDGDDETKPMQHLSDTVGGIEASAMAQKTIDVILAGAENERISIPIKLEYRVEGSDAVFVKETTYEVTIISSPLTVRAEAASDPQAGQPLTFAIRVKSNAKTPLDLVAVKLEPLPFGFTLKTGQKPIVPVGTLLPGEEKTVTLTGTLAAENAEQRVFHFIAGTQANADAPELAVQYAKTDSTIALAKPFLSSTLSINRDSGETPVIPAGSPVQALVSWVNTLPSQILDGQVSIKLSGNALDASSVVAMNGFYRSSDTTVVFNRETDDGLTRLAPGGTGNGSFTFATKSAGALAGVSQPNITATISVAGRNAEGNTQQSIQSTLVRTIKIGTDLSLKTRSLRTIGGFTNTGPWPPVADQESTYTIQFALSNTLNSVGDVRVTAKLPSYVRFTGAVNPSDGSLTYDPVSRIVTWNAGDVMVGAGYANVAKLGAFQVALLPSVSQRGTSPVLLFIQEVTGVDRFTKKTLTTTASEVTALTVTDPAYQPGFGEVK
ncbi:MAG: hypothetical protein AB199_00120 [Parcubacteria bacterium C7867-004]|nr:MAG: hypothetical protein AB199_00120 [Parcubacteria bacterium C7867-004]